MNKSALLTLTLVSLTILSACAASSVDPSATLSLSPRSTAAPKAATPTEMTSPTSTTHVTPEEPTDTPGPALISLDELPPGIYLAAKASDGLVIMTTAGVALGNLALGTFDTPAISPDLALLSYTTIGARFAFLDLASGTEVLFEPFDMMRYGPSWSPEPDLLVVNGVNDAETIQPHIGIIDTNGMTYTRLVQWSEGQHEPAWSPDGKWIAFSSDRLRADLTQDLFRLDTSCLVDPSSCDTAIDGPLECDTTLDFSSPFWSPDSKLLGSICSHLDGQRFIQGICVVDPATRSIDRILDLEGGLTYLSPPAWSPDGRWIAVTDPNNDRTSVLDPVSGELTSMFDLPFAFWIDNRAHED